MTQSIAEGGDNMSRIQDNFKRGTTELLVLYLLQQEEMYGYKIVQTLGKKSGGRYTLLEGSLYLLLTKMEEQDFITGRTELVGKKRIRKYYKITEKGIARYEGLIKDYDEISHAVSVILDRE